MMNYKINIHYGASMQIYAIIVLSSAKYQSPEEIFFFDLGSLKECDI